MRITETPDPVDDLTDHQKTILCSIAAQGSDDEFVKVNLTGEDGQLKSAADTLTTWGLIDFNSDGLVRLTPAGKEKLQMEQLTDESGQLTQDGQQFVPSYSGAASDPFSMESVVIKKTFKQFLSER